MIDHMTFAVRRAGRAAVVIFLAVLWAQFPGVAGANGWAYHSIPFPVLMRNLTSERPSYRAMAAEALGIRGEKGAVPELLVALRRPQELVRVKTELFRALGRIGDDRAAAALVSALRAEIQPELRAEAADALALVAASETLPALLEAFAAEGSFFVKSQIIAALGSFTEATAIAALARRTGPSTQVSMRVQAIRSLGRSGARDAVAPLIKALGRAGRPQVRDEVVSALGALAAPEARQPLIQLLEEVEEPDGRARIAVALAAIGGGDAVPVLIGLLDDATFEVRVFAVRGLLRAAADAPGGEHAARALVEYYMRLARHWEKTKATAAALADPRPVLSRFDVQAEIIVGLSGRKSPKVLAMMIDAARARRFPRDSSAGLVLRRAAYELRRAGIVGLGYTQSASALDILGEDGALGDSDFRVRAAAVRALGVLGRPGVVAMLVPRLGDDKAEVRWATAAVLGRLGDKGAGGPLLRGLSDAHPEVRYQATLSLGYLGHRSALEALRRMLEDEPSPKVRGAVRETLDVLGAAQ